MREENWPQAAGPGGDFQSRRRAPLRWSVAQRRAVRWAAPLPETGQSGVAVWGGSLFLTSMKPLPNAGAKKTGGDTVGYCLDSETGAIRWSVDLPAAEPSDYAYGFSDASSPTPATDGKNVWFTNSAGHIACCERVTGRILWRRSWSPTTGRPFNKQFEPILWRNFLLSVEPRDTQDPKREADPWNRLRALDARTGNTVWIAEDALTHYNTPTVGRRDGVDCVLQGRGGHHDVPEKPAGLSLTRLADGDTLWCAELPGKALYNMRWNAKYACWFDEDAGTHTLLRSRDGKILRTDSLMKGASVRRWNKSSGCYVLETGVDLSADGWRVFPAWFSNILVSGRHWFLCFSSPEPSYGIGPCGPLHCVGRIDVESGRCEYLELPTAPGGVYGTNVAASTVNSRGIDAASDPRSRRDGWHWNFNAPPLCLGGRIYWTMMNGVTYVLDASAPVLDERALLAVNDLGPVGGTWCLSAPGFDGRRLYYRTMTGAVCIGG